MSKVSSWEVTDDFWMLAQALIPPRQRVAGKTYVRKPGGGRKAKDARLVFEGIVYVLRTGCQWKALPVERFGSASAIHARFFQWERAGFFEALWQAGLAEYDDLQGVVWRWQSIDGTMMEAPLAREAVGPNPTDRGEKMGASVICWSTGVASPCQSSSPGPIGMMSRSSNLFSKRSKSSAPGPQSGAANICVRTRATPGRQHYASSRNMVTLPMSSDADRTQSH